MNNNFSKKNILVVTPYPLFPDNTGGRKGILSSIEMLSSEYNYHLLAMATKKELEEISEDNEKILEEYYKIFKTVTFIDRPDIPGVMSRKIYKIIHYFKHLILGLPLMDISYYSNDLVKEAKKIIKERHIDLLEVHHLHMAYVKIFIKDLPSIMINHNLETKLWPFWINGNGIFSKILSVFAKFSRYYGNNIEMKNSLDFDANAYVSQEEMNVVSSFNNRKFWLPTSFKLNKSKKTFKKKVVKLLWMGGFNWRPNVDACEWFLKDIFPYIEKYDIEVQLIGENPSANIKKFSKNKKVFVHGYVDDVKPYLEESDIFIVPLRDGQGIRVKILEAMNWGIPVVSTSKGCEGLPYTYGENILVGNDSKEFASCIETLIKNKDIRKMLSENGRVYIKENHSRKVIGNRKREIYNYVFNKCSEIN